MDAIYVKILEMDQLHSILLCLFLYIVVVGVGYAIGNVIHRLWIQWTEFMWRRHDSWMINAYRLIDRASHWCTTGRSISFLSCIYMLGIICVFSISLQYSVPELANDVLFKFMLWFPIMIIVAIHLLKERSSSPYRFDFVSLIFRLMAWYSACVLGTHYAATLDEEMLLVTLIVSLVFISFNYIMMLPLSSPFLESKEETLGVVKLCSSKDPREAKVVATHECGHVIMLGLAKERLVSMTLDFRPKLGATAFVNYRVRLDTFTTRYGVLFEMFVSSGGEMAEYLILGEGTVGSESDRDQQRRLAKTFAKFSKKLPYDDAPSDAWELEVRDVMIQSIIDNADEFTLKFLKEQRSQLELLINFTQDKDVFSLVELLSMIEDYTLPRMEQHLLVSNFESECYARYQEELLRRSLINKPTHE